MVVIFILIASCVRESANTIMMELQATKAYLCLDPRCYHVTDVNVKT
jgi:hypothetical protein